MNLISSIPERLSRRTARIFVPIGNWMTKTYLGLTPHSDIESGLFICAAFCFLGLACYLNSLP